MVCRETSVLDLNILLSKSSKSYGVFLRKCSTSENVGVDSSCGKQAIQVAVLSVPFITDMVFIH